MNSITDAGDFGQAGALLRGESEEMARWIERWDARRLIFCLATIFLGAGLFGGALGWWRDPAQALYGAIKFPLVILLTTAGTALLNGMLAPLLGLNLKFRQSLLVILLSYTIASIILGGFSPILLFVIWNAPPMSVSSPTAESGHSAVMVVEVCLIAFAGTLANVRLRQLLERQSGSPQVSWRVLSAWLVANLFLGAQLSWILRPFVGAPGLPVEFLRPNAFQGNFYETVFNSIKHLLGS